MSESAPVLILGLGNSLQGDDGAGGLAAQALQAADLPSGVEVMEAGTPGIGLLNLIEGRRRVILIDAADWGQTPGEVLRFSADQAQWAGATRPFSLHGAGVTEALALARALHWALPEMVVYAIQVERIGWGMGLSPRVQAALPRVLEAIKEEVGVDHVQ